MKKPSIGIEIELPWTTMLERVDPEASLLLRESRGFKTMSGVEAARTQLGFDAVDAMFKERVDGMFAQSESMYRGADGYAEFALRPAYDYAELEPVVRNLYDQDILREGERYPLHITLGGIRPVGFMGLVLMAAEIADGTTPDRVVQKKTWEQKGVAGVHPRSRWKLELDMTTGAELRSLMGIGYEAICKTMMIAQNCGGLLMGYLAKDIVRREVWMDLFSELKSAAEEKEIDASKKWPNPSQNDTVWRQLSAALSDHTWRQATTAKIEEIALA